MTLRVNPEFAAQLLAATTTNIAWSNAFKAGLGDIRRVICKRHADATTPQDQVYATGTKFRDAALTGPITISGGIPTGYGATSNLTTSLAADLATGIAILRIEGNGNWIEGTLGLVGSNCDFVVPSNPTATNSIAVSPNLRVLPPPFLPSGSGFAPPALDVDAPAYVMVDDWTDPNNIVSTKIPFDRRIKNWTFEDAEYAANIGDVRVTQSTKSALLGDIEVGFTLLSMDPQVGTVGGKVKHQVLGGYTPTAANWPGYPRPAGAAAGGYRKGTRTMNGVSGIPYGISNTFPAPHKIRIFTADNRLLGTIAMDRDGLPINDPSLSEVATATKPLRLHMHCASMVFWESHPSKLNSFARKYFSGIAPEFMRPSQTKQQANANGAYPPYRWDQVDSTGQWHVASKYSYPANATADAAFDATQDPYLYNTPTAGFQTLAFASWYGVPQSDFGRAKALPMMQQWGYEPGAWCMHDQYSGPGGYRVDRAIIPDPIAIHMTDPNWVHLHDGTPIATMVDHWNRAYFNFAIHHFLDVKTFASLPVQEVLDGKWANYDQFYGGGVAYTDIDHAVAKFVSVGYNEALPHWGGFTDANYRLPWNGFSIDFLHNYHSPGWAALLYNSPAHAVSQKFRYMEHIQCQTLRTKASNAWKSFQVRDFAWYVFQEGMMWKLASDHPLGISRAQVERRIEDMLVGLYTNVTVPVFVNNDQSVPSQVLRNFGWQAAWSGAYGGVDQWVINSVNLHYYMAHALVTWRQFGLLKIMMNRSDQCKQAILTIIKCLDKCSIDYYLDTDGYYYGTMYNEGPDIFIGGTRTSQTAAVVANGWADWKARGAYPVRAAQEDLVHDQNGNIRGLDIGEWSRLQWPFIRRDYFPDIPCDRDVVACCNKITAWMKVFADRVAALTASNASKRVIAQAEPGVHAALGRLLPPTVLEP